MMRTILPRSVAGFALLLIVAAACGYDPSPASGTLKCGPQNSCPDNYTCMSGACWRNGAAGSTGTGHGGGGGTGGTSTGGTGGSTSVDKFIGHWVFATGSQRVRVCPTLGVNETVAWSDFFDVTAGTISPLATSYYCDWNLDVNGGGTMTQLRTGTTCSAPDPNNAGISYTWTGESFTLSTTNGSSGTLDASIPYVQMSSAGSASCTMHFTGPVTKS